MAKREIKRHTAAPRRNILLVDDDPGVREALGEALCCRNYHVVPAACGREAVRELASTPIDIVLLDLNLGPESGWSTFQELISLQPLLPIIIITGQPHLYEGNEIPGARAFMEKPLDLPVLFEILEELRFGIVEEQPVEGV
jgi:DNA-binding NtrC family response regulator